MSKQKKTWELDEASKHFINLTLIEKKQEIIEFRHRWKLGDNGLPDGSYYKEWREKVERECQNLRREIIVLESEDYWDFFGIPLVRPILSLDLEGHFRQQNWKDNLEIVFIMEIRGLGKELKFPPEWDRILEHYVIYNVENYDFIFNHGINISIRHKIDEKFGLISENVCLTLGVNTGSEDLDGFWNKELRPLLLNLPARVKGKNRESENFPILEEMIKRGALKKNWQETRENEIAGGDEKSTDLDIALATKNSMEMGKWYETHPLEKGKYFDEVLSQKVKNKRYYQSKTHPKQ